MTRSTEPVVDFPRIEPDQPTPLQVGNAAFEDEAPHVSNVYTEDFRDLGHIQQPRKRVCMSRDGLARRHLKNSFRRRAPSLLRHPQLGAGEPSPSNRGYKRSLCLN